jgi:hypothetical protein
MSDTAHWRRTNHTNTTSNIPEDSNRQTITIQKKNESNDIQEKMNRLDMESPHDSNQNHNPPAPNKEGEGGGGGGGEDDSKRRDRRRDTRGRRNMAPPPKVINSRAALLGDAPDVGLGGNTGTSSHTRRDTTGTTTTGSGSGRRGGSEVRQTCLVC